MRGRAQGTHLPTTVFVLSLRLLAAPIIYVISTKLVAPFDSSHLVLDPGASGGLRWDAIHYASIAMEGYRFEQQLAFMPIWPTAMRLAGEAVFALRRALAEVSPMEAPSHLTYDELSTAALTVNIISTYLAAKFLYKLTKALTSSHQFASVSCLLYALSPHPAASIAAYTEPLYAALTFIAFYHAIKGNFARSTIFLALTSGIRATGILNIGVLGWMILFGDGTPQHRSLVQAILRRGLIAAVCCSSVLLPFLAFQYYAYSSFCRNATTHRPWCDVRIPFSYGYVQAEYWNIGLFKYWTVEQLPNFLLAAPVLVVSITPTLRYFKTVTFGKKTETTMPYHRPALLPFHIHHLALTLLLVVQSHTQIALRVSITDPVVWWNVAMMAFDWPSEGQSVKPGAKLRMTRAGKAWTIWALVWGLVSLFLWAGHYPPA